MVHRNRMAWVFLAALVCRCQGWCFAAPEIRNLSLRGLQIDGTTTLVIEGRDLLPDPQLVAPFPITTQRVVGTPQATRVEMTVQVPGLAPVGIFPLRLATAQGVSNAVAIGLDRLPQRPFVERLESLPVALHGNVAGAQRLTTQFTGKRQQRIAVDIEAQRLGAAWKPVVRLKDAAGNQVAWSSTRAILGGDARLVARLPADGEYTVEVHDLVYRPGPTSFFRLKIGDLQFADLAFPLGVQAGTRATLAAVSGEGIARLPLEADAVAAFVDGSLGAELPALPGITGPQPPVVISRHPEVSETRDPAGKPQLLPGAPIAVSGVLAAPGEEDQYLVPVRPGSQVRVEVLAQRVGSPLDGVLVVRDEAGQQLGTSDDRPGNADPGAVVAVPEKVNRVVVSLRDLVRGGGPEYVYRIEVTPSSTPQWSVVASTDRINLPLQGQQTIRLEARRGNYTGPIAIACLGLPPQVTVTGGVIPAGDNVGLVTFTSSGPTPPTAIRLLASGSSGNATVQRYVDSPVSLGGNRAAWLKHDFVVTAAPQAPVQITWGKTVDAPLMLGGKATLPVTISRMAGETGKLKLRLLSSQPMPRKKSRERNREVEGDDPTRALRFESEIVLAPEVRETNISVVVPTDLPIQDWKLAVAADLLAEDSQTVRHTATTDVLTRSPVIPLIVELAPATFVSGRAGEGPAGKILGSVRRVPGFAQPVQVTLAGLPDGYPAPVVTVPADQEKFELEARFPAAAKPTLLNGVQVVAQYQPDPKNAEQVVRSKPVVFGVIRVEAAAK